jgi:hypothetical protein
MVIGEPRITSEGDHVVASAEVRFDRTGLDVPGRLWYRFPAACGDYLTDSADPFVVALIMPAMLLGEGMVVEGRVTSRLAHGMREYRTAYTQWWPRKLTFVDIVWREVGPSQRVRRGGAIGCGFSGGIDSFYGLWKHLPANETVPGFHVSHALMVNGMNFDVDLGNTIRFQRLADTYRPLFERNGVELLVVSHNAQSFLDAAETATSKSPTLEAGLVSPVLMLGDLFDRFYISGSGTYRYEDNFPKGWHPSGLHLLSSDDTEMMFDGGDLTRTEKTVILSKWEETWSTLRVCWRPTVFNDETGMIENCCRCPKCVRTMLTLDMAGALQNYRTFPRPLDRRTIRSLHFVSTSEKKFYFDLLKLARATGRNDVARDLKAARRRSRLRAAIRDRLLRRPKPVRRQYRPSNK